MTVLVTAAGGKTGRSVVAALADQGASVRALTRSGESIHRASETVAGDAGELAPHIDGVETIYFIWPNFAEHEEAGMTSAIEAAERAGVDRIVYHSVLRPGLEAMPHHWAKLRAEERLAEGGLPSVILQPAAYMQNIELQLESVRRTGVYDSPWGLDVSMSLVDLADVAEIAARACFDDRMDGGVFELAGPDAITAVDVASSLSRALGQEVTAHDQGEAGWAATSTAAGMPPEAVRRGRLMAEHYRHHGFTGSPLVLESLLGRPATTLEHYLDRVL